jgi:hypothetical protein
MLTHGFSSILVFMPEAQQSSAQQIYLKPDPTAQLIVLRPLPPAQSSTAR